MFAINILVLLLSTTSISCQSVQEDPDVGIIGGHDITIEKVPFTVSLRLDGKYHFCGGSIYNRQFIITAAHCILEDSEYKVLVGTNKLHEGGSIYDVEEIFVHPRFNISTYDYDIAILKLKEPLVFSRKVNEIGLPHYKKEIKFGTILETVGWGYTEPIGKISETLRDVRLPAVTRELCQLAYGKKVKITERMICAGKRGEDTCKGDSGGPLIWRQVQIGITSFGNEFCFLPTVYTDIFQMLPWISYIIDNKHY